MDAFDLKTVKHVCDDGTVTFQYSGKITDNQLKDFVSKLIKYPDNLLELKIKRAKNGVTVNTMTDRAF